MMPERQTRREVARASLSYAKQQIVPFLINPRPPTGGAHEVQLHCADNKNMHEGFFMKIAIFAVVALLTGCQVSSPINGIRISGT